MVRMIGIWLVICLVLSACSKSAEEDGQKSVMARETESSEESSLPPAVLPGDVTAPSETVLQPVTLDISQSPSVSFEMLREARADEAGIELVYAEYPSFSVAGDGYGALSTALDSINEELKGKSEVFLNDTEQSAKEYRAIDASYKFGQATDVNISRCDAEYVCLLVTESVEEGGPHPNNYTYTYNLNVKTGERMRLSDVISVDAALREMVQKQLYENYPELQFDEALMEQEIASALDSEAVDWYFGEGQICIAFREGSFGFSHAEGSLGVMLPMK